MHCVEGTHILTMLIENTSGLTQHHTEITAVRALASVRTISDGEWVVPACLSSLPSHQDGPVAVTPVGSNPTTQKHIPLECMFHHPADQTQSQTNNRPQVCVCVHVFNTLGQWVSNSTA